MSTSIHTREETKPEGTSRGQTPFIVCKKHKNSYVMKDSQELLNNTPQQENEAAARSAEASEPASRYAADIREYEQVVGRQAKQGDTWLYTYIFVKQAEARRVAWYKRASTYKELKEAKGLLERAGAVELRAGSGASVSLGEGASELMQTTINEELAAAAEGPIFFFEGLEKWGSENEEGDNLADIGAKHYETLRGKKGRGEWARLLGMYVDTFLRDIPAWAEGLNDADKCTIVGELLERSGALAGCKGAEWVKENWSIKNKGEKVHAVKDWRDRLLEAQGEKP